MAFLNESCKKQDISFSLHISSDNYQNTEIHVANLNVSLIFLSLFRFYFTLLVVRSLVFYKILTNQIIWERRVIYFPFTTNLVILAQSMQKLWGLIDAKQPIMVLVSSETAARSGLTDGLGTILEKTKVQAEKRNDSISYLIQ